MQNSIIMLKNGNKLIFVINRKRPETVDEVYDYNEFIRWFIVH